MSAIPPVDGPVGLPPVTGGAGERRGAPHDEWGEEKPDRDGGGDVLEGRDEEDRGRSPAADEQDPNRKGLRLDIRG